MAFDATTNADPIDIHVGGRIRLRRKMMGLSQEGLADPLDLTFQQVQKYERGSNRVSASKLYKIARVLQVPIGYFFEGLENAAGGAEDEPVSETEYQVNSFLATPEGIELAATFSQITVPGIRRAMTSLAYQIAMATGLAKGGMS